MSHQRRLFWLAIGAGAPGSLIAFGLLWFGPYSAKVQWTAGLFIAVFWIGFALAVRERTIMPLQTLANLLEALREGDYSMRARSPRATDAFGEVMIEVNALADLMRSQRFDAVDVSALLERVIAEIDVAVFTFDEEAALSLVNRAGEHILAQPAVRLLGRSAEDLGLAQCLVGDTERTFEHPFPGRSGRWQCRRSTFREAGRPHRLLVLSDLSRALRQEERQAWQRLIRVLGHELKNSLTPIKSTSSTLINVLRRDQPHRTWRDEAERGLVMITERCESLNRFVAAYSRLARLPAPALRPVAIAPLVHRVISLESRLAIEVGDGPHLTIEGDGDQIEQLLINILKNAVEAAIENSSDVSIRWSQEGERLALRVIDGGQGISNPDNLFVPFFTTKSGGTGIGLVLSRQIAEAHGGSLTLENRADRTGCVATFSMPMSMTIERSTA